jgi:hypothetical protein
MRNDRKMGVAVLLLGIFFAACAASSPADESKKDPNATAATAASSVEKVSKERMAVYSPVLAVWRDKKTGELRSIQGDPARPPLLASK